MKLFFTFLFIVIPFSLLMSQDMKATEFKALINLKVTTLENDPIVNEAVMFVAKGDGQEFIATTAGDGTAQVLLPKGKTYDVKYKDLIEKVDYSSFEIPGGLGKFSFEITIKFEPSDVVELKGVIFSEDGVLDEISCIELDMMIEVLMLNPKMEIVIASHCDNSKTEKESLEYTKMQADIVKTYLVKAGVSGNRIEPLGIGQAEPIAPNALPEGRAKNNRIEIRVTKRYL